MLCLSVVFQIGHLQGVMADTKKERRILSIDETHVIQAVSGNLVV